MAGTPGPIRRAWYQWKMMRFPWRKKWLVGFDLQGNTFWEFKDALHALRNRRIAKYHRNTHYGDVKVSPSWMQWLRHTRYDPPSVAEQRMDMQRQERMKVLAAQADARWAAKPSALDAPDKQQPVQMLQSRDPDSGVVQMNIEHEVRERTSVDGQGQTPDIVSRDEQASPAPRDIPRDTPESATPQSDGDLFVAKKKLRKEPKDSKDSPWSQAAQPQEWQPQGWSPAPAKRRA
ncbi:hypothetical protein T440DRAFT_473146 [Plenodomus tracheiphilus IPT5]|uniref:Uncharacterized protein n=1 Tax=Plenodomus tracheiphilus IPT5 TaxID=1408161 RepID=A0A6A7ANG6_9PLEO|nr:hypothetical protein T440DRAFT_473146 [Plenodomus tracheiphilus IPT5]